VPGSLSLILHAHLPFVRHPEREWSHEESWLFEAITESYIPLLLALQQLHSDGVRFRITLSVSPTLAAMLSDALLRERYVRHLEALIALADNECERNRGDKQLLSLSRFYRQFFGKTRRVFVDEWKCDLIAVIRGLRDAGALELIASAATHAILPILQHASTAARAQIAIGCEFFRDIFGGEPAGFWLPECAYTGQLDELLQEQNIRWFTLEAHGLEHARPCARRGTLAPCFTPAGPAAFARDTEVSRQVWNAEHGYPGDAAYRDFYRDIGFDLAEEELAPLSHARGSFTGFKYHRVSGRNIPNELYVPQAAEETARTHAGHFVDLCLERLKYIDDGEAILVAPFDAELFGHWWFEGPIFLEHVIRAASERGLRLITPADFLRENSTLQIVQPARSSWGENGFLDVWLDDKCGWIYPHLHAANERMTAQANFHAQDAAAEDERVLRQLARELLLAQASDWSFQIRNGTATEYATRRVQDHLGRFNRLAAALEQNNLDLDFLAECEDRDNLFPNLSWRYYCHPERRAAKSRDASLR
jgi:1,4-alpha-glucan branching enzyme